MKTLESIVPPFELCKQIPEGKFADSVLCWVTCGDICPKYRAVDKRKYPHIPEEGACIFPAPTLEEILAEMGKYPKYYSGLCCDVYGERDYGVSAFIPYRDRHGDKLTEEKADSASTAALKLWLELNKGE